MYLNITSNNHLINNSLFNGLEYLFVISTILQCYSVYFVNSNNVNNFILKALWCILLFILLLMALPNIKNISSYYMLFFIYLIILTASIVLISFIHYKINVQLILTYFIIPICLSLLLYILMQNNYLNSIFNKFEQIMFILSIISLFFWILSILNIPPNVHTLVYWGSTSASGGVPILKIVPGYFYIHFIPQGNVPFFGMNMIRNTGIFMEAPIYSGLLDIALLIHLFIQLDKTDKVFDINTCILLLTLFSTTSTNGLLVAIPSIICACCMSNNSSKNEVKFIYIPIIICLALFILNVLFSDKADFGNVSSSSIRLNDYSTTLNSWIHHIIIGNGVGNDKAIMHYMAFWRFLGNGSNLNISVGFTKSLAYGGLILGIYYVIPLIVSFLTSNRMAAFSSFVFLLFILEDVDTFPIFKIIVIYVWISYIAHVEMKNCKDRHDVLNY